jgi:hypothetical protein
MKHHKLAKTPSRRNKLAKTSAGTNFAHPGSSDLELMVFFTLKNKAYSNLIHAGDVGEDSNLHRTAHAMAILASIESCP